MDVICVTFRKRGVQCREKREGIGFGYKERKCTTYEIEKKTYLDGSLWTFGCNAGFAGVGV